MVGALVCSCDRISDRFKASSGQFLRLAQRLHLHVTRQTRELTQLWRIFAVLRHLVTLYLLELLHLVALHLGLVVRLKRLLGAFASSE